MPPLCPQHVLKLNLSLLEPLCHVIMIQENVIFLKLSYSADLFIEVSGGICFFYPHGLNLFSLVSTDMSSPILNTV